MDAGPSRQRPTASARRLRAAWHADIEFPDAPSPLAEIVYENMSATDEVDEAARPCLGGSKDESALISFRMHIAASIWR